VTIRADFRFTFEDWNLFDNVAAWREATLGTVEERKAKLANPKLRQGMREEYDRTKQPKVLGRHGRLIGPRRWLGRTYGRSTKGCRRGKLPSGSTKHVVDAILDLSVADNLKTEWPRRCATRARRTVEKC